MVCKSAHDKASLTKYCIYFISIFYKLREHSFKGSLSREQRKMTFVGYEQW